MAWRGLQGVPRGLLIAVIGAAVALVAAGGGLAYVMASSPSPAKPTAARTVGTDRAASPSTTTAPTAAATTTSTTAVPLLAAGQQGTRAQVPWSKVGSGWVLATWQQHPTAIGAGAPGPTTLVLVDPAGGRYVLQQWTAPGRLVDWSGDGVHALYVDTNARTQTTTVAVLDVRTGKVTSFQFNSGQTGATASFSKPDGTAVLVGTTPLRRYSLTGALELTYPSTFPSSHVVGTALTSGRVGYAESPDGTTLALSATAGVDLVANNGKFLRLLPTPPGASFCRPVRWAQGGTVLVSCTTTLWRQPATGGPPTQLNKSNGLGFIDEWSLPGGTIVQVAGCGSWLDGLDAQGNLAPLQLPGFNTHDGHDGLVGVNGDAAAITVRGACTPTGAPTNSLLWYDPGNQHSTVVLGPPVTGGSVDSAVAWGGATRT